MIFVKRCWEVKKFHLRIQKSTNSIDFRQRNHGFHGCREKFSKFFMKMFLKIMGGDFFQLGGEFLDPSPGQGRPV